MFRLHLLECTEVVVITEQDLTRSGIQTFVKSRLNPQADEDILVICLKLAAFLADKHGQCDEILLIIGGQTDQLFRSDCPGVVAALLEVILALLQQPDDKCLAVGRWLVAGGLCWWPQLSGLLAAPAPTHHVGQLTLHCLVALLGLLQRCAALTSDQGEKSNSDTVNFEKVLTNILREYFEAVASSQDRLFKQLRCLLRLTTGQRHRSVRRVLFEFIISASEKMLTAQTLSVQGEDRLHVILETWLEMKSGIEFTGLCSDILATGQPAAQLVVTEVCCRHLNADQLTPRTCCQAVILAVIRERIFGEKSRDSELGRRFFRKTGLAVLLATHKDVVDTLSALAGQDVVLSAGELAEYGHLSDSSCLTDHLRFLCVLGREAGRPLLQPPQTAALLSLLAGNGGGSAELKTSVCDLLAVEVGHGGATGLGDLMSECLPAIGAHIVSSAQSWQLRDSAIQVEKLSVNNLSPSI